VSCSAGIINRDVAVPVDRENFLESHFRSGRQCALNVSKENPLTCFDRGYLPGRPVCTIDNSAQASYDSNARDIHQRVSVASSRERAVCEVAIANWYGSEQPGSVGAVPEFFTDADEIVEKSGGDG
jgi:hypothetical protein